MLEISNVFMRQSKSIRCQRSANRSTAASARAGGTSKAILGLAMLGTVAGLMPTAAWAKSEQVTLVAAFRTLNNPYHVLWAEGGKAFAAYIGNGTHFKVLATGPSNEAQMTGIRSLLASTPGKVVLVVDPATNSITQAIIQTVQKDPNARVVAFWNKPPNLWPWNGYSHWVSFISFNGVVAGQKTANVLFKHMSGSGNIIALQGILDNVPAKQRFAGLQKALQQNPKVHLLSQETANWSQTEAFKVTQTLLSKYGNKINGIWAANDAMAVGALQALKDANLNGKIPIASASDAIPQVLKDISDHAGIVATTDPDGYWDASVGLALGYYAITGKLDVTKLSHEQRAFYAKAALITDKNAAQYLKPPQPSQYSTHWQVGHLFDRIQSPVK